MEPEEASVPLELEAQMAVNCWMWMSEAGPLQGQRLLLSTEPSFQSEVL